MSNIKISASILSADFSCLADQIHAAEDAGVDWIHIDVIDGHFAPNITMGPFIVETCARITHLPLDVHLMIEKPDLMLDAFAKAGAHHLYVHVEGNPHIYRTLERIRELGLKVGIAFNPGTPTAMAAPILHLADLFLPMSVSPGFSGQKFISATTGKIAEMSQMLAAARNPASIVVDGGITSENLAEVYQAGARVVIAATAIFKHPGGIKAGVDAMRRVVD